MPHTRNRHTMPLLKKKLKFSRIVSIQGPRQCGKSFLARNLFTRDTPSAKYISLDAKTQAAFAEDHPSSFIESHLPAHPLVIDEAQKAPSLFSEMKLRVDQNPAPGQFLILGSTEFSKEVRVREALTGRLSRLRLFTFNLREAQGLSVTAPVSRRALMLHLKAGGFPGIFAVRDSAEKEQLLQDWIQVTVQRDLQQFPKVKLDADLALEVLREIALADEPTIYSISSRLKRTPRVISNIIRYLSILFTVHRLDPHPLGTGKPRYYLCDSGLVSWFGGSFERQLETWALHEFLSQASYSADVKSRLYYYRNSKGSIVHFLRDTGDPKQPLTAIKIFPNESVDTRELEILKALRLKARSLGLELKPKVLGHESMTLKKEGIQIVPWESIV